MCDDILQKILSQKRLEVAAAEQDRPITELKKALVDAPPLRDFVGGLRSKIKAGLPAVIAEVKKASPSKGVIRPEYDPTAIGSSYAKAGAACLSVLTDKGFFQGALQDLALARASSGLPVLRKDFIISVYQLYEARAWGADCVLLIVAALSSEELFHLELEATKLGMAVLVEVHDDDELALALRMQTPLIGINNRDLRSFETNLNTSIRLNSRMPVGRIVVSESGINSSDDVNLLRAAGIPAFLVGEAFMRDPNPGSALNRIFS